MHFACHDFKTFMKHLKPGACCGTLLEFYFLFCGKAGQFTVASLNYMSPNRNSQGFLNDFQFQKLLKKLVDGTC